jgi:Zn-dependent alcohol dehydrogenase
MKTKAAVLRDLGRDWEITELDLDPPKTGEVLMRWVAAGLCHSDEHLQTGDIPSGTRSSAATRARASSRRSGPV